MDKIETDEIEVTYLQWLMDGKKQGEVVEITGEEEDGGDKYYTLSDSTRVNISVVGTDVIKQIVSPEHKYRFKKIIHKPAPMKEEKGADGEMYYAPNDSLSLRERQGWTETKIIPPQYTANTLPPTQLIGTGSGITAPKIEPVTMNDPFIVIMDSISLNEHSLQIDIDAEMLPHDFFDMNSKYMEDGESKMIKYLVDKIINDDRLKLMIENSVKSFYVKKDEND